jgi:heme/copper-type cytochrome/quinol oxidase subunit 2
MSYENERRDFLRLMGLGGVVFASGLAGFGRFGSAAEAGPSPTGQGDFFFLQLSDTHWGFQGPANPEAATTLKRTVEAINKSPRQPDFIVFTGDLTHTTDDPAVRRTRMGEFKEIVAPLRVKTVHFMPGEHDAALDAGAAFQEFFGAMHYSFDHKGIHFVAVDNVSDPKAAVGAAQLEWLAADLAKVDRDAPVVVLTHRPLFDLYAQWDWTTADGDKVIALLQQHPRHRFLRKHSPGKPPHDGRHRAPCGEVARFSAARSRLGSEARAAAVGSSPPLSRPGLRQHFVGQERDVCATDGAWRRRSQGVSCWRWRAARVWLLGLSLLACKARPVATAPARSGVGVIQVKARRFSYEPNTIVLKQGVPAVLEFTSADRKHGFKVLELGLRSDIEPGKTTRLAFTPTRAGTFAFACDLFCGDGHEEMTGELVIEP